MFGTFERLQRWDPNDSQAMMDHRILHSCKSLADDSGNPPVQIMFIIIVYIIVVYVTTGMRTTRLKQTVDKYMNLYTHQARGEKIKRSSSTDIKRKLLLIQ